MECSLARNEHIGLRDAYLDELATTADTASISQCYFDNDVCILETKGDEK